MLRSVLGLGVVGLACAGVLLEASPASACGEWPCAQLGQSLPIDTAQGVPTNAELRIEYSGFVEPEEAGIDCSIAITQMRLTALGGEPSDIEAQMLQDDGYYPSTWMVARPSALQPNTEYVVTSLHDGSGQCSCEEPDFVEVMRFVTGDGPDEDTPELPTFEASHTGAEREDNTCGMFHTFNVAFAIDVAADAAARERYNVYADGAVVRRYVEGAHIELAVDCVEDGETFRAQATRFALRAVDIAGNESELSMAFEVEDDPCASDAAPARPDASVVEDGDGGAPNRPVVAATKPDDRGTGEDCSASGAASTGWTAAWIVLAVAFARRSRRR